MIPKELWYLVDCLYSQFSTMSGQELFSEDGLLGQGYPAEVAALQAQLDRKYGKLDTVRAKPASTADALFTFLRALAEPVIPFEHYHQVGSHPHPGCQPGCYVGPSSRLVGGLGRLKMFLPVYPNPDLFERARERERGREGGRLGE